MKVGSLPKLAELMLDLVPMVSSSSCSSFDWVLSSRSSLKVDRSPSLPHLEFACWRRRELWED